MSNAKSVFSATHLRTTRKKNYRLFATHNKEKDSLQTRKISSQFSCFQNHNVGCECDMSSSMSSTGETNNAGFYSASATYAAKTVPPAPLHDGKKVRVQTSDPKTWPLGHYFWGTMVYALKNNKKPPTLEFYFDGVRSLTLRIDENQFLLCVNIEGDSLCDKKTGKPLDLATLSDEELPTSRWNALGFDIIVDDDYDGEGGNVFACEIEGKEQGIANAIDIACRVFKDWATKSDSILDAVVTRWNEAEKTYESDRRYSDIIEEKAMTMHTRGTPHDSTLLYAQCGRNALLAVRTMIRARQARTRVKK